MPSIFWNDGEHRLRAGWRLLIHAFLATGLAILPIILLAEPLTAAHKAGRFLPSYSKASYDRAINMIIGPPLTLMFAVSVWCAVRFLDRRPGLSRVGIRLDRHWWKTLAAGLGIGTLLMTMIFGIEWAARWLKIAGTWETTVAGVGLALAFSFSALKVLCVGVYEELICRGYQLTNLREGLGTTGAVVISSSIFALLHLGTENTTVLSTISLMINGIMFATAALASGRLSFPIGLHIAWNFFEGSIYGFPVSGDKEGASVVAIQQLGPHIVTGGAYGPEGGLIGIAASIAGIALVMLFRTRSRARRKSA